MFNIFNAEAHFRLSGSTAMAKTKSPDTPTANPAPPRNGASGRPPLPVKMYGFFPNPAAFPPPTIPHHWIED
ncbi:hypothetical protein C8035_v012002 [Colletotrichum spinosum]|uniref:Uncharacterized protein n=1 Tax=Colletotrichum spinosum TaxID=1347390 RepID=A0A4R8PSX6_9PEZI|nr:hypothetical protein C8035_v012002 [Colletotrichum spinosum]